MLKGKVAVITGASRGIGAATAEKFASLGADVAIICANNVEKAELVREKCEKYGVRAKAYACDISDFSAVKTLVNEIKTDLGTINILVNNAGITRDKLVAAMRESDFDDVLNTNLKGAFNMIRHCSTVFIRNRGGKIINISSVAGITGNTGQANYAASKAGLIGLTKSVARELASKNVSCNAIAPGFIATDMTEGFTDENPMVANIPLGRMGKPEEVAALAAFLASDSGDYITGEVIRIDGGIAM